MAKYTFSDDRLSQSPTCLPRLTLVLLSLILPRLSSFTMVVFGVSHCGSLDLFLACPGRSFARDQTKSTVTLQQFAYRNLVNNDRASWPASY